MPDQHDIADAGAEIGLLRVFRQALHPVDDIGAKTNGLDRMLAILRLALQALDGREGEIAMTEACILLGNRLAACRRPW